MKRLIFSAIMLIAVTASSFASITGDVTRQVLNSFYKTYANAKQVSIEEKKDVIKITFVIDGQKMFAYYQPNGEQIAVTRNILVNQLPINLSTELKEKMNNKWLTELFEVSKNGETAYFAVLLDANTKTILKAETSGGWEFYNKTKRTDN